MERNESLRTYLGRKLESMPVGAVPPSNAACIFLIRVLSVVNQQIGIESYIITRNPIRGGPPPVRQAKGRLVIREIHHWGLSCLDTIAHSGTWVTNQSGSDAEGTYVKWGTWYLMTDNLRQVTKVHRAEIGIAKAEPRVGAYCLQAPKCGHQHPGHRAGQRSPVPVCDPCGDV